ncbi:DUF1349 domain-containing protein [Cohnella xylanilytica]|uniref:DUF1349 domain-containing protein n=1 Tax=Cohnella xylanilytica TaxID=557555 RepID=A0A841U8R1_9BACL|nr:DUF1349 domain-containing protein [Cohnella xylanilytica]MBB6695398.1 DUF1349 domain-containing protein [Cohnella xylanilytica]
MKRRLRELGDGPPVSEGCGLSWMNEPDEWSVRDGRLTMVAPARADFFNDPGSDSSVATAPFLYAVLKGDFVANVRLSVEMAAQCDSGCLMAMSDDSNWAKICFEYMNRVPTIVTVVTRSRSDDCNSMASGTETPFLRLARSGSAFAFHYSEDGTNWELVRYFRMEVPDELKIGVVAQAPFADRCKVTFYSFETSEGAVEDVRTVS